MATYQVTAPEQFNFSKPEEWQRWIRRFQRFRQASGLSEKGEEAQVNTLIYTMGSAAEDILASLSLSDEEREVYETVENKLNDYFVVRRNTIYERAKFNQRIQMEGESVDTFITSLYHLAEHCGYGVLHDEMIRDRIVVGLRDQRLAEKLQLDSELTLAKAAKQARQSEAVKKQQSVIRNDVVQPEKSPVDAVYTKHPNVKKQFPNKSTFRNKWGSPGGAKPPNYKHSSQKANSSCSRCGYSPNHPRDRCPAKDKTCSKCKKRGHFMSRCLNISEVVDDFEDPEEVFLGEIGCHDSNPWCVNVQLQDKPIKFKIDTGADVTVIPKEVQNKLKNVKLRQPDKILNGPGQNRLEVSGMFTGELRVREKTATQQIYVVEGLRQPLLGRPAVELLGLVTRVEELQETSTDFKAEYPELFQGLGKIDGPKYQIKLRKDAFPFALTTPRRVPIPLLPKVKAELTRMEELGVIARVDEPSDWCAGMVVVPKPNGKVRICVDLTKLNESVEREKHPLPAVDQTLAQLTGAKLFSKLDANSGFWQVELSEESALLTTFISPFGRYNFRRLPFGISSAPEHFQKKMTQILEGHEGVVCQTDDVLVYGRDKSEHDKRLHAVLQKLRNKGVTLNDEKCEFAKTEIKFVGHVINGDGIKPDPDRVNAIRDMNAPTDISGVRRFLGMVNQMGKFSPNLAEKTKPIRDLLSKNNLWTWDNAQEQAFIEVKQELCSSPVLALYDPNKETIVSADASSYGIGAVITQVQENGVRRPVACASRALTPTEQRYAQIEKEALALTWACDRFHDYILGLKFRLETDHKPLIPLLGSKSLSELPPRIQRFRMRLMRFSYDITHVPGKELYTPDTLSRSPIQERKPADENYLSDSTCFVEYVIENLPATVKRLDQIRTELKSDPVCSKLMTLAMGGWPTDKAQLDELVKPYWGLRGEITMADGLLLKGDRLVIPPALRAEILEKLHEGHLGIAKCRERAKASVWWIGLSSQIEDVVNSCHICAESRNDCAEPLIQTPLPKYPWQRAGTDLFHFKGKTYLLVVDYFSRYVEIARLTSTTSEDAIVHLKSIFGRHGIPEVLVSDNGPQYASEAFVRFSEDFGFEHVTSSPRYPQSNGEAERTVQTIKKLLRKNPDPYVALLSYRSTPLQNGYSPAELCMGRRIRTKLPVKPDLLVPKWTYLKEVKSKETASSDSQKQNYDRRHRAKDLPTLNPGDRVWIKDFQTRGEIVQQASTPRSYIVNTPRGEIRRNRRHLTATSGSIIPEPPDPLDEDIPSAAKGGQDDNTEPVSRPETPVEPSRLTDSGVVRTRSGRISVAPNRMDL